jgi:Holliday junction resolvase RusA-like endonuclease
MTVLCIVNVPGLPVPQGSVEAALNRVTGKAYVRGVKPNLAKYRADIREGVTRTMSVVGPLDTPMVVRVEFNLPRPKSHYNAKGGLTPRAPSWPSKRPDVDKMARAVLDALTGTVWHDDAQVVRLLATKQYATFANGRTPSTSIIIEEAS